MRRRRLIKHLRRYKYGWVIKDDKPTWARFDTESREVYFVLWKAGENGHRKNYWHKFGCGWLFLFKPIR